MSKIANLHTCKGTRPNLPLNTDKKSGDKTTQESTTTKNFWGGLSPRVVERIPVILVIVIMIKEVPVRQIGFHQSRYMDAGEPRVRLFDQHSHAVQGDQIQGQAHQKMPISQRILGKRWTIFCKEQVRYWLVKIFLSNNMSKAKSLL